MRYLATTTMFLIFTLVSSAHYHLVIPSTTTHKVNEAIQFAVKFGHPFEHEFHEFQMPKSVTWTDPDGKTVAIEEFSKALDKDNKLEGIGFTFTPTKRGAYLVTVTSDPIWMDDEKAFYRDVARVWVMVESPKGWNTPERAELDVLTRPFGVRVGMTFRGQFATEPERPHLVEFEKYNPVPAKELPPDEHVTYATRTDKQGTFSGTLPEAGWWSITLTSNKKTPNTAEREGKKYTVIDRHTVWVYVEDKIVTKPVK